MSKPETTEAFERWRLAKDEGANPKEVLRLWEEATKLAEQEMKEKEAA